MKNLKTIKKLMIEATLLLLAAAVICHLSSQEHHVEEVFGEYAEDVRIVGQHKMRKFQEYGVLCFMLEMDESRFGEFADTLDARSYNAEHYMKIEMDEPGTTERESLDQLALMRTLASLMVIAKKQGRDPREMECFVRGWVLNRQNPRQQGRPISLIELESDGKGHVVLGLRF